MPENFCDFLKIFIHNMADFEVLYIKSKFLKNGLSEFDQIFFNRYRKCILYVDLISNRYRKKPGFYEFLKIHTF